MDFLPKAFAIHVASIHPFSATTMQRLQAAASGSVSRGVSRGTAASGTASGTAAVLGDGTVVVVLGDGAVVLGGDDDGA